jgi:predicted metalloprotease with PDZ domain
MAESAAVYLNANPDRRMVILCGIGHVEFGVGIPKRLERRTHASYAIVISSGDEIGPHIADYLLLSAKTDLPPHGALDAKFENKRDKRRVRSLDAGGAAQKAGLRKGDVLLAIDGQPIKTTADERVALWEKAPGERVQIRVQRQRHFGTAEMDINVTLAAAKNNQ